MVKRIFFLNRTTAVSTSTSILFNVIDVREFESFTMFFHNEDNTPGTVAFTVQAAHDPDPTGSRWISVPTTTIAYPSSLGSGSGVMTSQVRNDWSYLRVLGQSQDDAAGALTTRSESLRVQIGGHVRHVK